MRVLETSDDLLGLINTVSNMTADSPYLNKIWKDLFWKMVEVKYSALPIRVVDSPTKGEIVIIVPTKPGMSLKIHLTPHKSFVVTNAATMTMAIFTSMTVDGDVDKWINEILTDRIEKVVA